MNGKPFLYKVKNSLFLDSYSLKGYTPTIPLILYGCKPYIECFNVFLKLYDEISKYNCNFKSGAIDRPNEYKNN